VRVVSFNLHAGVDGWGRRTGALAALGEFGGDVFVLPELWRGANDDMVRTLEADFGLRGLFVPLAEAERSIVTRGGPFWQPLSAHLTGEHGLYFSEHRELKPAQRRRRGATTLEEGSWGLGLFTRLAITRVFEVPLERLRREKVNRSVIIAQLRDDEKDFYVVAIHAGHISHGSHRHFRRIQEIVAELSPTLPVIMAGDFNAWRPVVRWSLPGWRSMVRAKTWPARLPHSQIDHVLARGDWRARAGYAVAAGSDHRALVVDLELG